MKPEQKVTTKDGDEIAMADTEIYRFDMSLSVLLPAYVKARDKHRRLYDQLSPQFKNLRGDQLVEFWDRTGFSESANRWSAFATALELISKASLREVPLCLEHAAMQARTAVVLQYIQDTPPRSVEMDFFNNLCDAAGVSRIPKEIAEWSYDTSEVDEREAALSVEIPPIGGVSPPPAGGRLPAGFNADRGA